MAGKIKEIIDNIIQERSKGNPAIAEMTKAKFILKGINLDKFDKYSVDDTDTINMLLNLAKQLNIKNVEADSNNIKSILSVKTEETEVVRDIIDQLQGFEAKVIIFFSSSCFNLGRVSSIMQESFQDSIVFGCSTAGEIENGVLLKNSVVAMAFNSVIIADAKVEVIEKMQEAINVEAAFSSFEEYYHESCYTMDATRYFGIVLIDGLCRKEEKLMDQIGNHSNVYFVGGSAGDDRKYTKTFVCANGKSYVDATVLALIKLNDSATFDIIKTQSYKILDKKLIATKVNEETREVIEFDYKPAILAYAEAVGATSIEEAPKYFATNPVGLIIGGKDIFVRSPQETVGTRMKFYCNLLEGMEVRLLKATNIVEDTRMDLEKKKEEFGKMEGIINFQCVQRTRQLENRNMEKEYAEIFNGIPNVGFSTYGEEYIGHMNQTSTMLVFKSGIDRDNHNVEDPPCIEDQQKQNEHLEETIEALKEFNIMLEAEINERTKREEEVRYMSYHDMLTGLYNRRFYEEEFKRVDVQRNLPISIIMGDVNGLKLVNDSFGHEKGDELLIKAAEGIQRACRADDIAARWGGDEFVILLPKTSKEEVQGIIDRIKEQYAKEQIHTLPVSISFGWDTKNNPDENLLDVLKRAEDYMYENKIIEKQTNRGIAIEKICVTLYEKYHKIEQHSKKVGEICQKLGKAMGLSEIESSYLKAAGLLHDMGKIVIEENILNKKGHLTEQDWMEIKRHPEVGYKMLNTSYDLEELAEGILSHHERWDGNGYPKGLKGESIPMVGRILSIADSYAAMTSERSYGKALGKEEAIAEVEKNIGIQFDPEIAKIFIEKVLMEEEK